MRRRAGRTSIWAALLVDGRPTGEARWVEIAPHGSRPRFSPDGSALYYLERGSLFSQKLDASTMRPIGQPVDIAQLPVFPSGAAPVSVVSVARDRLFFNTYEVRSNVWMTRME